MRDRICPILPWLALALTLLGMRTWDPRIPIGVTTIILLLWAINWLLHHISLRWLRYLRIVFLAGIVSIIIVVPQLRALFEAAFLGLLSLESRTLLVLAVLTLVVWGAMCLAQPVTRVNE